jgi:hypothetical protein
VIFEAKQRACGVAAILVLLSCVPVAEVGAQAPAKWQQPRTPWGDPNLEGVWTSDNNYGVPLERPPEVADKEFLDGAELDAAWAQRARRIDAVATGGVVGAGPSHWYENLNGRSRRSSLVIDPKDGRIPTLTAAGRERVAADQAEQAARNARGAADSYTDRNLWDRCITVGLPGVMFPSGYNNNVKILQAPGYVTITHEMMHDSRVIPLDGSPHLPAQIRNYFGDSRARWEGDTLAIDVTNFRPETNYRGSHETLHIVERYTRLGDDRMQYTVTVDDPHTWERPWTAILDLEQQKGDMYEYACHEGNLGLENILKAARFEEARAAKDRGR